VPQIFSFEKVKLTPTNLNLEDRLKGGHSFTSPEGEFFEADRLLMTPIPSVGRGIKVSVNGCPGTNCALTIYRISDGAGGI
jgi:hypothetical protein